jgi:hypothetical protein
VLALSLENIDCSTSTSSQDSDQVFCELWIETSFYQYFSGVLPTTVSELLMTFDGPIAVEPAKLGSRYASAVPSKYVLTSFSGRAKGPDQLKWDSCHFELASEHCHL